MNELKTKLYGKKDGELENVIKSDGGESWPRSADAYELTALIGHGAFARVYQASCPSKGKNVAIKVMELDNLTLSLADIYQEVRVMLLSKHPCVLPAHACFVVKHSLWLVMPLMRKGSCLRIMKVLKRLGYGDGLKEEWIATILKSALLGLEYFHQHGQLHRDIKASNLLMNSDGSVRISDFGVAGWMPRGSQDRNEGERRTFVGTPCWMAPEVMEQTQAYDEKADIWSFGITALELAKGYAPYARMQPMKVLLMTIQSAPPSLKSYDDYAKTKNKFSRHFREVVTMCLQKTPAHRPSASTLLGKTFFKRANADSFLVKDMIEACHIIDSCESALSNDRVDHRNLLNQVKKDQEDEIMKQRLRHASDKSEEIVIDNDATKADRKLDTECSNESSAAGMPIDPSHDIPSMNQSMVNNETSNVEKNQRFELQQNDFQPGATWVFDDEEHTAKSIVKNSSKIGVSLPKNSSDSNCLVTEPAVGCAEKSAKLEAHAEEGDEDVSGFEAFASVYAQMDIKGEDGKTPNDV